jgi:branched-chain amino acid transport system substrate-binding protein
VERGITPKSTKVMGQGEITSDEALKNMGDAALGIVTAFHYDWTHKSAKNDIFVKAYNADYGRNPDFFSVGGWDGMQLIYDVLKKTGGKTDAQAMVDAAKGMSWDRSRSIRKPATSSRPSISAAWKRSAARFRMSSSTRSRT